jgi:hypothetical protein
VTLAWSFVATDYPALAHDTEQQPDAQGDQQAPRGRRRRSDPMVQAAEASPSSARPLRTRVVPARRVPLTRSAARAAGRPS